MTIELPALRARGSGKDPRSYSESGFFFIRRNNNYFKDEKKRDLQTGQKIGYERSIEYTTMDEQKSHQNA